MQPNQQTPPPTPPDPNTPPVQPVRHAVIQPLSSEDDIRQAAASSGAPARPSEPSVNPASDYSSGVISTGPAEYEDTYQGGLITEPIHRPNQISPQYTTPALTLVPVQAKKPVTKTVAIIFALLIAGVLGLLGWVFLSDRVSAADLVTENVAQSTYLRPKQWTQFSPGVSGYGNVKAEDGKPSALVSVNEFPQALPVTGTSDAAYSQLRKQFLEEFSDRGLATGVGANTPIGCDENTFTATSEEDTTKTKTTVGLVKIVGSCKKGGGTITMKMRLVIGMNDRRARMIIVGGTDLNWKKNEKSFQQMLNSIEERTASYD